MAAAVTEVTIPVHKDSSQIDYYITYRALKKVCQNNEVFFAKDDSEYGQRLHEAFYGLATHIDNILPLVDVIRKVAHKYDFDSNSPGNGYRSFVRVVDCCISHGIKVCSVVCENRDRLLFRKSYYAKEVEACNHLLASLCTCMLHLQTLIDWSEEGSLFPENKHTPEELFSQAETINQYCFYGRCLGFQFCDSMKRLLKGISICMAGFSEAYYSDGNLLTRATSSFWTGGKYLLDPELRARRIVNISQYATVDFCKSFWLLAETEAMTKLPAFLASRISVNKVIAIPPEPLKLLNMKGEIVDIPIPSSHGGPQPIQVRLLSAQRREGMVGEANNRCILPSRGLIIHCHGGGFVAQSSKSHELYLKEWATELDVPILSIDYSLAPDWPFPRALEEVFYVYCWALENCLLLGSTGESIVLAGDSAGGNLNLGLTLKCIESFIRKPSGLFLAYVPVLISFVPSPARLLCLMDPLLPFGFMMRCLKAYACPNNSKTQIEISSPQSCPEHTNMSPASDSLGQVSESDMLDLEAHRSNFSDLTDTITNASLSSNTATPCKTESIVKNLDQNNSNYKTDSIPTENILQLENGVINDMEEFKANVDITSVTNKILNCNFKGSVENNQTISPDSTNIETGKDLTLLINKSVSKSNSNISLSHDSEETDSDKFVSDFLEKYASDTNSDIESILETNGFTPEENKVFGLTEDVTEGFGERLSRTAKTIIGNMSNTFNNMTSSKKVSASHSDPVIKSKLDALIAKSPSDEFQFQVPRDPYLSPYWADDNLLREMPAIKLLSIELDPCLDDCVMFAKKLKSLGNDVDIEILSGLPHGFLSFSLVSKDAHKGSMVCVEKIKELLNLKNSNEN